MNHRALYVRVSSQDQNIARQRIMNYEGLVFIDKISGAVAFRDRPEGGKLYKKIESGQINFVQVKAIDRLGRSAYDIQATINFFQKNHCQLFIDDYGIKLFNDDKSLNPIFKLITDLLSNIAEIDRNSIREKQKQGVCLAKLRGVYAGRKSGTEEDREKFLSKYPEIVNIIKVSNGKLSANAISKMVREENGRCKATPPTVRKIINAIKTI